MTTEQTHRAFHATSRDQSFTVRPDLCADCRGVVSAARARGLLRSSPDPALDEVGAHPEYPPTYGELRRRLGLPAAGERTVLDRSFRDRVPEPAWPARSRGR